MNPGTIAPLSPLSPALQAMQLSGADVGSASPNGGVAFAKLMQDILGANATAQAKADDAVQSLAFGDAQDLHSVALAMVQADLSFRLVLEMRNRLTDAYQEIMRQQV